MWVAKISGSKNIVYFSKSWATILVWTGLDKDSIWSGLGQNELNMAWEVLGRQLAMEQRTRYIAFNPVEVPRDPFINSNQNLLTFVDTPSLVVSCESTY